MGHMCDALIRSAVPDDEAEIVRCIAAAYAPARARGISVPPVEEGIGEEIAEKRVWVIGKADRILGVLNAGLFDGEFYIQNVAVHPESSGRGYGRALLECAEGIAQALNVPDMHLATHRDTPENVALYEHMGWHISEREGLKVLMVKVLGE